MDVILLRAGWLVALGKHYFISDSAEKICSLWYSTLTGVPIAGQILSSNNGEYHGLIIFAGLSYALALVCLVASRILAVGWKLNVVY